MTCPRTVSEKRGMNAEPAGVFAIAKGKNRTQVRTSVGSLASKFKWKRTNLETKVEAKVEGTGWLN